MANPIVTGLTQYVADNAEVLYGQVVLGIENLRDFTLQPGAKGGKVALNILTASPALSDGATCGVEDGEAEFSHREIEIANYKSDMAFCERQLLPYCLGLKVKVGEDTGDFAFEEAFTKVILGKIEKAMEKNIWQGAKGSDRMDGIFTIAANDATPVSSTGSTVYEKTLEVYMAAAGAGVEGFKVYMSKANYLALVQELVAKNLFHYNPEKGDKVVIPGTDTEVVGVRGLEGNDHILAINPENIHYAFDEFEDMESVKWVKDEVNDKFYFKAKWNAGVQIAFPTEAFYL